MSGFQQHTGLVVPLDAANVDTDAIIPKQFAKVNRTGFGKHLFHDWRFLDDAGEKANPEFVMNQPRYQDASICSQERTLVAAPRANTPLGH